MIWAMVIAYPICGLLYGIASRLVADAYKDMDTKATAIMLLVYVIFWIGYATLDGQAWFANLVDRYGEND